MTRKRRDREDFRELGAYLQVAREALLKAEVKVRNMYRQDAPQVKKICRLRESVDGHRVELDNTWPKDLTPGGYVPGPEPIFGGQHDGGPVAAIGEQLRQVGKEAERRRVEGWGDETPERSTA